MHLAQGRPPQGIVVLERATDIGQIGCFRVRRGHRAILPRPSGHSPGYHPRSPKTPKLPDRNRRDGLREERGMREPVTESAGRAWITASHPEKAYRVAPL